MISKLFSCCILSHRCFFFCYLPCAYKHALYLQQPLPHDTCLEFVVLLTCMLCCSYKHMGTLQIETLYLSITNSLQSPVVLELLWLTILTISQMEGELKTSRCQNCIWRILQTHSSLTMGLYNYNLGWKLCISIIHICDKSFRRSHPKNPEALLAYTCLPQWQGFALGKEYMAFAK